MLWKSCCSAFLMYSKIPMPQVEWKEENRRYALCFFPCIGAVIAILLYGWYTICRAAKIETQLYAAGAVVLPLLITGGIHLDGFCDVSDALASCASKEKKLQIMSDPHIGAFAAIKMAMYLLLQYGLFASCREEKQVIAVGIGYIVSRALSALAAVTFQAAKKEGSLQDFAKPAYKKQTCVWLGCVIFCCFLALTYGLGIAGVLGCLFAVGSFLYYKSMSYRMFGGITGDLAGYFLQICELMLLAGVVIGTKTGL